MTTPIDQNLLGGPPPTYLPDDPGAARPRSTRDRPVRRGRRAPDEQPGLGVPWPTCAAEGRTVVESYAYARVGYHRGLDLLRRNGWKGHGPVPWEHEPNRGFLRCLHALARAAARDRRGGRGHPLHRCSCATRRPPPTRSRVSARLRPDGRGRARRAIR